MVSLVNSSSAAPRIVWLLLLLLWEVAVVGAVAKADDDPLEAARQLHFGDGCQRLGLSEAQCAVRTIAQYERKLQLVETGVHSAPSPPVVWAGALSDLGSLYLRADRLGDAARVLARAVEVSHGGLLQPLANLAIVHQREGQFDRAAERYRQALALEGEAHPVLQYNLGLLYYTQFSSRRDRDAPAVVELSDLARDAWLHAIRLQPSFVQAWMNLAVLAWQMPDRFPSHLLPLPSKGVGDRAIRPLDESPAARLYLSALAVIQDQSQHHPSSLRWLLELSLLGTRMPELPESAEALLAARTQLWQDLLRLKGWIDRALPQPDDAGAVSLPSLRLEDAVGCAALGYYVIYQGFEDLAVRHLFAYLHWRLFFPSLHFVAPFLRAPSPLPPSPSSPSPSPVIKVGFLSAFFYRHSVGLLLQGVISQLNPALFQVHVIDLGLPSSSNKALGAARDSVSRAIREATEPFGRYHALPLSIADLDRIQAAIAALQLDVLVFCELGMDPRTYYLSFGRLARRSVVFWGHALSSGVNEAAFREMSASSGVAQDFGGPDYFVSSRLFELGAAAGTAQAEYSERLVLMDGMTTYFLWPNLPLDVHEILDSPPANKKRRTLEASCKRVQQYDLTFWRERCVASPGSSVVVSLPTLDEFLGHLSVQRPLSTSANASQDVLVIPQTLYKLHPSFDRVILSVLDQRPAALLLLIDDPVHPRYRRILDQRWRQLVAELQIAPEVIERILFLPQLDERKFLTLCALADLVLDPYPVGGGRSSFEVFSTGTPIITPVATTTILQLTFAMYRVMGVQEAFSSECCVLRAAPSPPLEAGDQHGNNDNDNDNDNGEDDGEDFISAPVELSSPSLALREYLDAYVRMVMDALNDPVGLARLRTALLRAAPRLYENASVVTEWEALLQFVHRTPRPEPQFQLKSSSSLSQQSSQPTHWLREEREFLQSVHRGEALVLRRIRSMNATQPFSRLVINSLHPLRYLLFDSSASLPSSTRLVLELWPSKARNLDATSDWKQACFDALANALLEAGCPNCVQDICPSIEWMQTRRFAQPEIANFSIEKDQARVAIAIHRGDRPREVLEAALPFLSSEEHDAVELALLQNRLPSQQYLDRATLNSSEWTEPRTALETEFSRWHRARTDAAMGISPSAVVLSTTNCDSDAIAAFLDRLRSTGSFGPRAVRSILVASCTDFSARARLAASVVAAASTVVFLPASASADEQRRIILAMISQAADSNAAVVLHLTDREMLDPPTLGAIEQLLTQETPTPDQASVWNAARLQAWRENEKGLGFL